jgi:glycosyltransferase involved in cell wall biosynthesis
MRILWFTSTPSLAAAKLNADTNMTGWVASLEKQISTVKEINLGIAFPYGFDKAESFKINDTCYYSFPFWKEKGKIIGLWDRWTHAIEPEDEINYYLKIIEDFKPNLIHIFGSERSFGNIINHIKIPVVLQIQGILSVCTLKYFSGFSSFESVIYSHKKSFLLGYNTWHQFYTLKKRAIREQKFMSNFKFIIGRTDWDKSVSKIIAPESKYFHCDEILRDQFYKNQWSKPQNKKFIIFSTLSGSTYKGFETILMTAWLLKSFNSFNFEWHIAGIEETHEIISIVERASKLKFSNNNVIFRGLLNADELAAGLLASDCYVHTSHIENSSNGVCEAMLLGLPVIATYAGGTPSIVQNRVDGLLVQDGDPYVLAGAIKELSEYPEKSGLYSRNARQKALLRHNQSTILENMVSIYKSVINH